MANWRNSAGSYGFIAQAFHWLIAVLVLAQLGIGLYAANLSELWLPRHRSLGLAILALVLLWLGWRAFNPPPELPGSMPRWQRRTALATHGLLFLLLILAPLAGWLYTSAAGVPVNWFGLLPLPELVSKNRDSAELFKALHVGLVALLASLVALHVGAALRHWFLLRDGVMHRMLPWKLGSHR